MPFQKGNTLGAKGRPKGSKNKATDVNKFQLQQTLYNMEEFVNDFKALSPDKKMDIRMKAMSFFYSRPTMEVEVDTSYTQHIVLGPDGEDVSDEIKHKLYQEGKELPIFYDGPDELLS